MAESVPGELIELLRRYEPDVQAVALALRRVVIDEVGPCHESIFQFYGESVVSILYSTTPKRMKDNICLAVIYRNHVNLMFPRGVDLTDPKKLLEGSGKVMRHVKMLTVADTARPGVRDLLKQAKKRPDLGKPARPLKKVETMVKAKTAPKRPALPRLF